MSSGEALVTLVSYCSRERAFIADVVANARLFSDLVVVSIGTKLYTGEPEDVDAEVERVVGPSREDGGCPVIAVVYDVVSLSEPIALHNQAREAGLEATRRALSFSRPFWALMLDGDEVPDGDRVAKWWRDEGGREGGREVRAKGPSVAYKMANRWAFLSPKLMAEEVEDSVLLVHSDALLHRDALKHPRERDGIYLWHHTNPLGMRDMRVERRVGLSETAGPMFTHYSWVRDPDSPDRGRSAIKAKCANWGHRHDRDWDALIDAAFDGIDAGRWPERDFVHGYRLRVVPS